MKKIKRTLEVVIENDMNDETNNKYVIFQM